VNCGEVNINVIFKTLSILDECINMELEDKPKENNMKLENKPKENNMKKYDVQFGKKVQIWVNNRVIVEAENEEEALKKAFEGDIKEYVDTDYLYDTEEVLETDFDKDSDVLAEIKE